MSDPSATDESSDSGSEDWATAYDSEFDLTLSDVDDDLLEAMRNFNVDDPHPIPVGAGDDETQYMISTTGATTYWSQAARAQRGGAHVHALVQRKKIHSPVGWYVIIVGRSPGIYAVNEGRRLVRGVSKCIYQGYPTREAAENAWAVARQAGMIGSPDGQMPLHFQITSLPLESALVPHPSPLATPGPGRRFYVVYRGRVTGIFNSSLECGLSVVGVPGNAHESQQSYAVAKHRYWRAVHRGEVETVVAA